MLNNPKNFPLKFASSRNRLTSPNGFAIMALDRETSKLEANATGYNGQCRSPGTGVQLQTRVNARKPPELSRAD